MTTPRYLVGRADEILFLSPGEDLRFDRAGNVLSIHFDVSAVVAFGSMYLYTLAGPGTTVTIAATDTFTQVPSGFAQGILYNVTFQNSRQLQVARAGLYQVAWVASVECGLPNREIEACLLINGVAQVSVAAHIELQNANRPSALAGVGMLGLAAGDLISLAVLNHTSVTNLVVDHATVQLHRMEIS